MTEIATEKNSEVRTPKRFRPERHVTAANSKIAARYRKAQKLLDEFCATRDITPADLRERSQNQRLVALRRRYARKCAAAGIGQVIIAHMLELHCSTVAAYLSDTIIARKVERKRRLRESQKAVLVSLTPLC